MTDILAIATDGYLSREKRAFSIAVNGYYNTTVSITKEASELLNMTENLVYVLDLTAPVAPISKTLIEFVFIREKISVVTGLDIKDLPKINITFAQQTKTDVTKVPTGDRKNDMTHITLLDKKPVEEQKLPTEERGSDLTTKHIIVSTTPSQQDNTKLPPGQQEGGLQQIIRQKESTSSNNDVTNVPTSDDGSGLNAPPRP